MKTKFVQEKSKNDNFDEVESREETPEELSGKKKQRDTTNYGATGGDGASIEVVKRRRGRPPGSKNKPKPPVIVTTNAVVESDSVMRPYILEISAGNDIVEALVGFSRRRKVGISVLSATGSVSNISIRQPSTISAPNIATLTFNGRFEILSISGTVFLPTFEPSFAISVAGPRGQIVGGIISGPLVASDITMVIAAVFSNPEFVKIPDDDDVSASAGEEGSGGDGRTEDVVEQQQQQQQNEYHSSHHANLAEPSIYSRHLPSDVIWSPPPTRRPPF